MQLRRIQIPYVNLFSKTLVCQDYRSNRKFWGKKFKL